jgi:SAM-dependent methyltransferase
MPNSGDEFSFEDLYARAGDDLAAVPWASLAPHPALVAWLDQQHRCPAAAALVIGCGYGDDAEELSRRGYRVTAFDISSTAIAKCRQRFPDSAVDYRVVSLFRLPETWREAFHLVVEIRTLQSLALDRRADAVRAIAQTVAPGGIVWLRSFGRGDQDPIGDRRPWPVSRRELDGFELHGLREREFVDEPMPGSRGSMFTVVYQRD